MKTKKKSKTKRKPAKRKKPVPVEDTSRELPPDIGRWGHLDWELPPDLK